MSQDSDSDEDRVPKGSMVLNELAQFDEDTNTQQQQQLLQDDENLLADEMPQVEFVPDEEEEEPVRIQEEEDLQEPKVQEQLSEQDHEEADEGEPVVEQT